MISAVFRMQCDGPCKGWLSYVPDISGRTPSDSEAAGFRRERAARSAAERAGWRETRSCGGASGTWLCPACALNPLGIVLPKPQCSAVTPSGLIRCQRPHGHPEEHRSGTVDWF